MLSCRLCSSPVDRKFTAFGFEWQRCANCHAIQKILTRTQYDALNPSYDPGAYFDAKSLQELETFLEIPGHIRFLERFCADYAGLDRALPPRFLDVGCGLGAYLLAAQRMGFVVQGFEPSREHARVATELLGLPVVADYYTPGEGDDAFDVIMLSHVIEHIYDQAQFLDGLVRALAPGGTLIVVTPNSHSAVAELSGRYWPMLRPVDHVSLISSFSYRHFQFSVPVTIDHHYDGYPHEFASTIAAAVKNRFRKNQAATNGTNVASALRTESLLRRPLMAALTIASVPARLLPSNRQPCLITRIQRGK